MGNLLVAQSGGPTAAINATVAGVVSAALASSRIDRIYGAVNGIQGVLEERITDLRSAFGSVEEIESLCQTPAAALGSCRLKLKDLKKDEAEFRRIIEVLKKFDISCFIYIGGNDSMDTVDKLSAYCSENGLKDVVVVGAPKTIDNDLVETDHCPGFGSAAKYIGTTFAELERDCHVYALKAVTIVEVMGRNAGWLTAAASLSRVNGGKGPDFIYLCERAFDEAQFIEDVKGKLESQDAVLVAISEGLKDARGKYISEGVQTGGTDAFGHARIAGAAAVLEALVKEKIGCKTRSIELNLMQRCAGHIASATDIRESRMVGMKAVQCALEGTGGIMVTMVRKGNDPYRIEFSSVSVSRVSNREKTVPDDYINARGNDVTDRMTDYLLPLIQGEHTIRFEKGIPVYKKLY